jgi:hypothetical protein
MHPLPIHKALSAVKVEASHLQQSSQLREDPPLRSIQNAPHEVADAFIVNQSRYISHSRFKEICILERVQPGSIENSFLLMIGPAIVEFEQSAQDLDYIKCCQCALRLQELLQNIGAVDMFQKVVEAQELARKMCLVAADEKPLLLLNLLQKLAELRASKQITELAFAQQLKATSWGEKVHSGRDGVGIGMPVVIR